jgi:alpha-glucosidase
MSPVDPAQAVAALPWWQRGVLYEVYLPSFADSNGDGFGDLPGLIGKLDYLEWLGVDGVWVSSFYESPFRDCGFDIADHRAVLARFGTIEHVEQLVRELHRRNMKLIVGFVPNHTSSEHAWFRDAQSSRSSPHRDYYIWRDAAAGGAPPNNWRNRWGHSAWTWHEATAQYYLHDFLKEQPALDWRCPAVLREMSDVLRFWLDKGVDGFRIDALSHLLKDEQLRDDPLKPHGADGALLRVFSGNQPGVHELVKKFREVVAPYGALLIGEMYEPIEELAQYYSRPLDDGGVEFPFNFHLITSEWEPRSVAALLSRFEAVLPHWAWPNWVLGNHDQPRVASRLNAAQARVAAMLLMTVRGTPFLYYGDELGMADLAVPADALRDLPGRESMSLFRSRDPCRCPMLWSSSEGAGFSSGTPWLPIHPDYRALSVEAQRADPASMLCFYKALLALRRREAALVLGTFTPVMSEGDPIVAYVRSAGERRLLVVLNLTARPVLFRPHSCGVAGEVLIHTGLAPQRTHDTLALEGDAGVLIALER